MTATIIKPAPASTMVLLWAEMLTFRDLDQLATAWRDDTFPGRTDLRHQAQMLLFEAGLRDPFAELTSDLGHALQDLGIVAALLSTATITADSPECRLAYPAAKALFDGDLDRVILMLINGWSIELNRAIRSPGRLPTSVAS